MIKKVIPVIVIFVTVVLFGAAWHFSTLLMNPEPFNCTEEHFTYCGNPDELGLSFEDVTFKTVDGFRLRGWYIPRSGSSRAIVFIHGRGADRHEGMRWVKAAHRAGFNLLLFDLRNCGASDASFCSMGYHEKKDVSAALDYLAAEKGIKAFGLFGVSMGSATGITAMARDKRVLAGVFEAGWANLDDLLTVIAKRDFGLPRFPLIPIVLWLYDIRGDMDTGELNPEETVKKISPRPVFIIHCTGDDYIPYEHGKRVYASAGDPKKMWSSSCNAHAEAWQSDSNYAENEVVKFFMKHVKQELNP